MRRNTAKVLRQARSPKRLVRTPARSAAIASTSPNAALPPTAPPVPDAEAGVTAPLTLGELIASAYDVVGDDPQRVAELLASPELRRRINRTIIFV